MLELLSLPRRYTAGMDKKALWFRHPWVEDVKTLLSQRYILKFLFPYVLNRLAQKSEMKRFEFKTLIWVMPLHANLQGASHEFWPNRVFASDGFSAVA